MSRFNIGFILLTFLLGLWGNLADAEFPSDPKPCKYHEVECIKKLINYFLSEKSQGDSAINLDKVDPLTVSKINLNPGAASAVNIDLTFLDSELVGFRGTTAYKVKGFGKDLTKKHEIHLQTKGIHFVGNYKIKGRVLVLPITGEGKCNLTMYDAKMIMKFSGTPVDKDGATYMTINNMRISIEPKRINYNFENLFNGDKALGDNMNLFLNENWRDIYGEVRKSLEDAFAEVFAKVINNVFAKQPYEKFFAAEE